MTEIVKENPLDEALATSEVIVHCAVCGVLNQEEYYSLESIGIAEETRDEHLETVHHLAKIIINLHRN